jgi:hypothetical protein
MSIMPVSKHLLSNTTEPLYIYNNDNDNDNNNNNNNHACKLLGADAMKVTIIIIYDYYSLSDRVLGANWRNK